MPGSAPKGFVRLGVERERRVSRATAVSTPYLRTIGGQSVYAVDVSIGADKATVRGVPIAETARAIRGFVEGGTPVEIMRDKSGQAFVTGLSGVAHGAVSESSYSCAAYGLAFAEGWRKSGVIFVTGGGSTADPGTPGTQDHEKTFSRIQYGSLDYGVTPYGATMED